MKNQILFGRRIRTIRNTTRLSRERVAERAGINPNYLGEIERGEKWPSLEVLESLSKVLNVQVATFFEYDSYEPNVNLLKVKLRHILENRPIEDVQRAYRLLRALFEL
jgi:transcriptional regulator with XRE-family HTH domain